MADEYASWSVGGCLTHAVDISGTKGNHSATCNSVQPQKAIRWDVAVARKRSLQAKDAGEFSKLKYVGGCQNKLEGSS